MKLRHWIVGAIAASALVVSAILVLPNACGTSGAPVVDTEPAASSAAAIPAPAMLPPAPSPSSAPANLDGPRVVLLGFDGASHHLAQQFIAEGRMPWCKKLMDSGTFLPLGSANPAESPVAWASINTGENPGKTNIFGFIRRTFAYYEDVKEPGKTIQIVAPAIGYSRDVDVPFGGDKTMPSTANDLRCVNFWDRLDQAGIPSRVLQAACNFPATAGEHTRLLAGLSVPDVRGGPGTYLVFTNSEWDFNHATNNGGEVTKFKVVCPTCKNKGFTLVKGCSKCNPGKKPEELSPAQKVGYFETRLKGPENFVDAQTWRKKVDEINQRFRDAKEGSPERQQIQKELNTAKSEKKKWDDEKGNATVALSGVVDRGSAKDGIPGTIRFQLAGKEFTLKEGEWSDYVPISFQIDGAFEVKAAAHLHVLQCNEKAEDVRFYLPAITAAADGAAPNLPVVSPSSFGAELVKEVGHFDTIGWSCQTHALKDDEIKDPSFMTAIWDTIQWRRKLLLSQLEKPDWRTLFQVFGETDRVCHMMYRYFDEQHPQYKAEEAEKTVRFGEREIRLKDAIPAVYEEVDRTIGLVMERIEKGTLGDCTLMVRSDHGLSPFREEVELNAWLIEQGFLTVATEPNGQPKSIKNFPHYIDWSKTKAYSLGIGTIYLNLKGREPEGIVTPETYDSVCDAILEKMRAYKNPNPKSTNDPQVFAGAWKRSQYLAGPFAADIRGEVKVKGGEGAARVLKDMVTEGAADIQVGFNFGYRVAWGTALGDRATGAAVFPNKSKWSGDHTSVHPYLVRGIFFCNKKPAAETMPHLQDLAPTILALQGVAVPADMDGRILPLPGLEEKAKAHQGGSANRESLVPPAK